MTRVSKAMAALRLGLSHSDDATPIVYRYGQLLGAVECALEHLARIDAGDVAKWIGEECCGQCGSHEVVLEFDGGLLFCAAHARDHQRQLDWIAAVAELPEAKATLRGR